MKSFVRTTLLGAAALVAMSLSAQAASSTTATDTPAFKPRMSTELIQVAQRSENPGGGMFRNENPGGGMYKKSKKKKAKKK
jgi:Spy/CpxP family protein refolding chaperone